MFCKKTYFILGIFLILASSLSAQEDSSDNKLEYHFDEQLTVANGNTPLWLNANKYGLSSIKGSNGYVLVGAKGQHDFGVNKNWKLDYGADVALAYNFTSSFVIQQLYAGIQTGPIGLWIGSKERPANLKNAELSSGSQTFGINARPIPDIRIEIPEYFHFLKHINWFAFKFHFGYGLTTDQNWQSNFVAAGQKHTNNIFVHTKSGFVQIGDERKFPLIFEGGLEWATQFGGTAYNVNYYGICENVKMNAGLKDFFKAIYAGGEDPIDIYPNSQGNSLGSWLCRLSYKFQKAKVSLYFDHFFEDHSQFNFKYGCTDGIYGCELSLPKNSFVQNFVYEYIKTDNQSGPIYHDWNSNLTDKIGARDDYYNHAIYTGWQHWGQAIGNPLYTSPIYNSDGKIMFENNRFRAHHFGICGNPANSLHYRLLYTYSENWGTYPTPFDDKKYNTSFLAEVTWSPERIGKLNLKGNTLKCAFGFDKGKLLGNNTGFQITYSTRGLFKF
jgi:hypothetical protein